MFNKRNGVPSLCALSPNRRNSLCFISELEGRGEVMSLWTVRAHLQFAVFYKRILHVLDFQAQPRNADSHCLTSELEGCGEVMSLRSVPERFKFAMFYKRNFVVLASPANPRNANSQCFTSDFDVSQLGPTARLTC